MKPSGFVRQSPILNLRGAELALSADIYSRMNGLRGNEIESRGISVHAPSRARTPIFGHHGASNYVFQFADISGPVIASHESLGAACDPRNRLFILCREAFDKVALEEG
jgi:hypothetical protein